MLEMRNKTKEKKKKDHTMLQIELLNPPEKLLSQSSTYTIGPISILYIENGAELQPGIAFDEQNCTF